MITRVKSTVFTNKKTVGSYANIAFDTYIELGGGKEDVLSVEARMHYFERGSGKTVLLLHGAAQSYYTFKNNQDVLSEHFHVVMPDLLGHGYSDCPDISYSVEEYSLSLETFLKTIGVEKCSIIAFGQAAAYALDFASFNGNMVEEMVFIHPGAFRNTNFPGAKSVTGPFGGLSMAKFAKEAFVAKSMEEAYFDKTIVDKLAVEEYTRPFQSREVVSAARLAIMNYDESELAGKIGAIAKPMLVVESVDDPIHNVEDSQYLTAHMKDAYSLTIRNCGYFPQEEKPDAVNEGILEFISR